MKKILVLLLIISFAAGLAACADGTTGAVIETTATETSAVNPAGETSAETDKEAKEEPEAMLNMTVNGTAVQVEWEDNESVRALKELCAETPLTVQTSAYGGFEQVGPLGNELPRNDKQTVTEAGDIVLYSGNQLVVFYGSNSWAYTRLGKITGKTPDELSDLLGNGDATIVLSISNS